MSKRPKITKNVNFWGQVLEEEPNIVCFELGGNEIVLG